MCGCGFARRLEGGARRGVGGGSGELFDADVAVADELFGVVAAAVDLEGDGAGGLVAEFFFLPFHDFDPVDPSGDERGVALDAGAELVPLAGAPEIGPAGGIDGEGGGRRAGVFSFDFGDFVGEVVVAQVGDAAQALAVDAHEVAAGVVVDHGLPGLAVLGGAEEESTVGAEVVVHFEGDFEVGEGGVAQDEAAVAGDVLAAGDGAVFDDPAAAAGVFARAGVAAGGTDVPTLEGLAVEEADKTDLGWGWGSGFGGRGVGEEGGGEGGEGEEGEEFHGVEGAVGAGRSGVARVWRRGGLGGLE